jgi:hypothetical protein
MDYLFARIGPPYLATTHIYMYPNMKKMRFFNIIFIWDNLLNTWEKKNSLKEIHPWWHVFEFLKYLNILLEINTFNLKPYLNNLFLKITQIDASIHIA